MRREWQVAVSVVVSVVMVGAFMFAIMSVVSGCSPIKVQEALNAISKGPSAEQSNESTMSDTAYWDVEIPISRLSNSELNAWRICEYDLQNIPFG